MIQINTKWVFGFSFGLKINLLCHEAYRLYSNICALADIAFFDVWAVFRPEAEWTDWIMIIKIFKSNRLKQTFEGCTVWF